MSNEEINIDFIKKNDLIIFEAISGSHAYGTNIATSDKDIRGVFILPEDYILGNKYIDQVNDKKNDIVYYEIRRFLELLHVNNPNILELLNVPLDCIIYKHPVFDIILDNRDRFITKLCKNSFYGYAKQQIAKARGLNKKQNWEQEKITRREPIDFCYVIDGYNSYPLKNFLAKNGMDQKFCGVTNVPHTRDVHALFYDWEAHYCFSELVPLEKREKYKAERKQNGLSMGFGYKGIYKTEEGKSISESNALRLSSIPNGEKCEAIFSYGKDAYSSSAKDFKEYEEWLKNRNTQRWTDVKSHGQQIDGKNMLHCKRLIDMSIEIARGEGIKVRRDNAADLLKVRRGEISLEALLNESEEKINMMDEMFEKSNLPDSVDGQFIHNLLVVVRKKFYRSRIK